MKITLDTVCKSYPNKNKSVKEPVRALCDFSLEIPDRSLICLLGPSGCGKSTALNLISGLQKPTSGRILFGEEDVTELPPEQRGIGMVFQSYALYPHLTAAQNIRFPLENLRGKDRLPKETLNAKVKEVAEMVEITELLDRKPGQMSGGQQQRVAIARALIKQPRVLLLDEPLSNLDARLRLQTREEIRRLQRRTGVTTVFVTHDQDEAMSISDEIVVMQNGYLRQHGAPQDVYNSPDSLFVAQFLGTPPINVFDARIENGSLMIGGESVMPAPGIPDGPITAAIRPEGFIPDENGPFSCGVNRFEELGRDSVVLAHHEALTSASFKILLGSDHGIPAASEMLRLRLKPNKVFLFDKETGARLHPDERSR